MARGRRPAPRATGRATSTSRALSGATRASPRLRVLPNLGARRLTDIERRDVQALVDRRVAVGDGASTIGNALLPLRAIYRRALAKADVAVNPTTGPELPAVRGTCDPGRVA